MASIRVVLMLVVVLTLYFAAPVAAQSPIGPICLEPTIGGETSARFVIFALPMGGSQFLLSAAAGVPYSGAASLQFGGIVFFTLMAGAPSQARRRQPRFSRAQ